MLEFTFKYLSNNGAIVEMSGSDNDSENIRDAIISICKAYKIKVGECFIMKNGVLYDKFTINA